MRYADRTSQTWTPAYLVVTPTGKKLWYHAALFRKRGTHTDDYRLCITDDGHRTIPTTAIVPIQPALDLPLCALLIAHRQDERVLIPRHPPPSQDSGIWCSHGRTQEPKPMAGMGQRRAAGGRSCHR